MRYVPDQMVEIVTRVMTVNFCHHIHIVFMRNVLCFNGFNDQSSLFCPY